MNKAIFSLLFISFFAGSVAQPPRDNQTGKVRTIIDKSVKARIDSTLKNYVDSGKIAGVSALVFEKNKEVTGSCLT